MWHLWIKYIVIMACVVVDGSKMKPARRSLVLGNPFTVFWNVATYSCIRRHKVDLEFAPYGIVANVNATWNGSVVTIFYANRLGYYPFHLNDTTVNGGVPQNQDLHQHLTKTKSDIDQIIPAKMFNGLGVIDWERWKPLWERNVDDKTVYKDLSIDRVQNRYPNWGAGKIREAAKKEFEEAARNMMNSTLYLAKTLRPYGLWGYYIFPDCNNSNIRATAYTGKCPNIDIKRNNLLSWLWKQSTALFPSIFMLQTMKSNPKAVKFVKHRVLEALRIATEFSHDYDLPVLPYLTPAYTQTTELLTKEDLVSTIGESAALGAAGVVLWGNSTFSKTKNMCVLLKNYINGPLGVYVVNVTTAAKFCSQHVCSSNGKCVRRQTVLETFLHLPSPDFKIRVVSTVRGKIVSVRGKLKDKEIREWKHDFKCQCFPGWTGIFCEISCSY